MLVILSPSKTLDFKTKSAIKGHSLPSFLDESKLLINELRKLSPRDIATLMDVNGKIASQNFERYAQWDPNFTPENAKQAFLAFKGEVYNGLKANTFTKDDFVFAQDHVRMLSGLYGVLRPLDLMQAYRLEMGIKLKNPKGSDLYSFWGDSITRELNILLKKEKYLINLASNEYFKAVKPTLLNAEIITPVFKELKGDELKIIVIYMKKARGMMTRFIIKNRLKHVEELKLFDEEGYFYNEQESSKNEWVFTR